MHRLLCARTSLKYGQSSDAKLGTLSLWMYSVLCHVHGVSLNAWSSASMPASLSTSWFIVSSSDSRHRRLELRHASMQLAPGAPSTQPERLPLRACGWRAEEEVEARSMSVRGIERRNDGRDPDEEGVEVLAS